MRGVERAPAAAATAAAAVAATRSPINGYMQAWARGAAAATARGLIHKRTQAKAGTAKDAAAVATSKLGLPWVAAARSPTSGHAQA